MSSQPTPLRPTDAPIPTPGTVLYVVSADDLRQVALDAAREALRGSHPKTASILPNGGPLNQTELARLLHCSTEHVRQLEKGGAIRSYREGNEKLYPADEIAALFRRRLDGGDQ